MAAFVRLHACSSFAVVVDSQLSAVGQLTVLMFHGVVKDMPPYAVFPGSRSCLIRERDFEACIEWCARTHRIVTLADVERYRRGEATEPGVLITFDDGLASVTDLAVPILARHHATALLFVTTGWVDGGHTPAIFILERDLWERPPEHLTITAGRKAITVKVGSRRAARPAISAVWDWCFAHRVAPVQLRSHQVSFDGRPWEPGPANQDRHGWFPATWDALSAAAGSGVLEIGAHGATHTPFSWLSAAERRTELGEARERLESVFGTPVRACSYPHGMHDAAARAAVAEHYDWAFTSVPHPVGAEPPQELPRFQVPGQRPVWMDAIVRWPFAGRVLRKSASLLGWH